MAWLSVRDPFLNMPIGWIAASIIFALALGTILIGARWGLRCFASLPEPEGDAEFTVGHDGRRIDVLPATPWPQRCLGWLIWPLGIALLLQGTHMDACSVVLTLVVLCRHYVNSCFCRLFYKVEGGSLQPGNLRPLMSAKAYEEEGQNHTAAALAKLRAHLQMHSELMKGVSRDSELSIRRFADGSKHFDCACDLTAKQTLPKW